MGIVWEAYHKGVPLLGVPRISLDCKLLTTSMVVEMVPLKGGIGSIFDPPEGKDYKWYILPIGGLYATDPTF